MCAVNPVIIGTVCKTRQILVRTETQNTKPHVTPLSVVRVRLFFDQPLFINAIHSLDRLYRVGPSDDVGNKLQGQ